MICPCCETDPYHDVEMKIGFAIAPKFTGNERSIMSLNQSMKIDEIKIIDCWKCPLCGHSDDGKGLL